MDIATTHGVTQSFIRNVKAKIAYHVIIITVSLIFCLVYLIKHDGGSSISCAFSVIFAFVGLYIDVQFLRGHWKIWPHILKRYFYLAIVGLVFLCFLFFGYMLALIDHKDKFTHEPVIWLILGIHWTILIIWLSKKYQKLCTESYTLSKSVL